MELDTVLGVRVKITGSILRWLVDTMYDGNANAAFEAWNVTVVQRWSWQGCDGVFTDTQDLIDEFQPFGYQVVNLFKFRDSTVEMWGDWSSLNPRRRDSKV